MTQFEESFAVTTSGAEECAGGQDLFMDDLRVLQALADKTAAAMENVRVLAYDHLPNATFVWRHQGDGFVLEDFNMAAAAGAWGCGPGFIGRRTSELFRELLPHLEKDLTECFEQRATIRREVVCRLPGDKDLSSLVLTYGYIPQDMVILHTDDVTATLTQQLLVFSRKRVLQPKVVCINDVVTGLKGKLRNLVREDIDIVICLADDLAGVEADPGQIEQVIMNLVLNSVDAMPQGGRLTIETDSLKPGQFFVLSISDTGSGIDRGTGFGMAAIHGIVKQSGGYIIVQSDPGHGTTSSIYLPRKEAGHETVAGLQESGWKESGGEDFERTCN